ncbi:hypothetical protein M2650_09040 [Luteimonas sp. SX5]|uniref:Transmembrane protein n=1 Tax=Luteimonas galliterrae TaxID=2940486 RepID=A0ABT0MKM2_9GAMM|nr:DUF6766 family protein [Luteimonas galliterrae]MCL1634774.1 hypothetical protein [Luteimonas galliterrae]
MNSGFLRSNGLSVVLLIMFAASFCGQLVSGFSVLNDERIERGMAPVSPLQYLGQGQFLSATFENWESEFLQMGLYVLLTVRLRQRGSAESRPMHEEKEKIDPGPPPWPVRAGGWWRRLYAHSLSGALLLLFAAAFVAHWLGSWRQFSEEAVGKGEIPPGAWSYLGEAQFWFESFQNWQSEFLSVLTLVLLSIFLRQDKSPQSKPVAAPHSQTGT